MVSITQEYESYSGIQLFVFRVLAVCLLETPRTPAAHPSWRDEFCWGCHNSFHF